MIFSLDFIFAFGNLFCAVWSREKKKVFLFLGQSLTSSTQRSKRRGKKGQIAQGSFIRVQVG